MGLEAFWYFFMFSIDRRGREQGFYSEITLAFLATNLSCPTSALRRLASFRAVSIKIRGQDRVGNKNQDRTQDVALFCHELVWETEFVRKKLIFHYACVWIPMAAVFIKPDFRTELSSMRPELWIIEVERSMSLFSVSKLLLSSGNLPKRLHVTFLPECFFSEYTTFATAEAILCM